jgi:hypothetical protein
LVVALLVVAAAVGGALAGCHPTGLPALDALYGALLAALVTVAAAGAGRASLLVMATLATMMSRGWLTVPAAVALALAFGAVLAPRPYRRLGALIGALSVQVILRWPPLGFHGGTALLAVAAVTPVLVSAWRNLRSQHRSRVLAGVGALLGLGVVLSLPAAVSALSARGAVQGGTDAARQSLDDVAAGKPSVAVTELKIAAGELGRAHQRTAGWWDLGAYLVPVVAQQQRAMAQVTAAGRDLASSASVEAGAIDFESLKYHQGQIDLSAIGALINPVNSLKEQIASAQAVVGRNRSGWLLGPVANRIAQLRTELAKAGRESDLAALAVNDAPALLGADGERHYFVAFVTPAETRGLEGFIGAYGELTVNRGHIALTRSGQATHLVTSPSPNLHLTGPPDYVARYGPFKPQDNFEDLTYSPDFPTVESVVAELYSEVGGDRIDGVLALDPAALAALLNFSGPVTVPGLDARLTPANAAEVLLRQQYTTAQASAISATQRHDYLQAALAAAFGQLTAGSLPAPEKLASTLGPLVDQGRLLFWSSHPADQPLLSRLRLEGAFPEPGPGGDVLAVTLANAANNKIDAYLRERVVDSVRYDPVHGSVSSTVTVSLDNTAPDQGLPPDVIGSFTGSGLSPGSNYGWLSVYSPFTLTSAAVNGTTVALPGWLPELGVRAYSLFVTTPARSTSTVTLAFAGQVDPGSSYGLDLRLQPLASPSTASVSVEPVAGWAIAPGEPSTWVAGADLVQQHGWRFHRTDAH